MSELRKTIAIVFVIGLCANLFAQSQTDPILLEVGDRKVPLSEFEAVYKKNNPEVSQESVEEYLDLYVKFRLKVKNAEDLGLDTLEKFKKELAGYRKQLAEPYLSDNEVTDELIKEAYERSKLEVKASHILIKVGLNAKAADTLVAYKKAEAIKKRLLNGEDFDKVASQVSDDPSAKSNGGSLGYFSVLYMVYPFESAVYNAEVGKIAGPVRTQFGYHIIKVEDKRPNRGEITTAHIMTRIPNEPNEADIEASRMKINEIYDKILAGSTFEDMAAQFSEDKGSASRGGLLPAFSAGRMVTEYENAAFALQNDGDISKPIQTQYGFHIIKRISLKSVGTLDETQHELKLKISRDSRSNKSKAAFISRVKKENNFKENLTRRNEFYKALDSTYFQRKWSADKVANLNKELFRLGENVVNQREFAKFLESNQPNGKVNDVSIFVNDKYNEFVAQYCTNYEDERLEIKYVDFRMLMQEYHDGILLFDLTDEKVWSKAVTDSAGLEAYYQKHKNEHIWGERAEAVVYNTVDEATAKKVKALIKSRDKKGYTDADILKLTNETSQLSLSLERGKFSKGDNPIVDEVSWKKGISSDIKKDNRIYFVEILNILPSQPKELVEIKGLMTSGYQSYLEEQWLDELRSKYPVIVHKEYLTLIK